MRKMKANMYIILVIIGLILLVTTFGIVRTTSYEKICTEEVDKIGISELAAPIPSTDEGTYSLITLDTIREKNVINLEPDLPCIINLENASGSATIHMMGSDSMYIQVDDLASVITWDPEDNNEDITLTIFGTSSDDIFQGYRNVNNIIYGYYGNDVIEGGDKDDILFGESGNDTIYGGSGADLIYPGAGSDSVYGGSDLDCIFAVDGVQDRVLNGWISTTQQHYAIDDSIDHIHMDKNLDTCINIESIVEEEQGISTSQAERDVEINRNPNSPCPEPECFEGISTENNMRFRTRIW